jgi:cytochrome c-type biogenesis protein CcsB
VVIVVLYSGVLIASVAGMITVNRRVLQVSAMLLIAALLVNTGVIVDRWIEAGRPPFKTLYETLIFVPWCVGVVSLALLVLHRLYILLPFSAGASMMALGFALYRPDADILNLPPALQSGWFVPHVVTYFVSYAALFASAAVALVGLLVWGLGAPRWLHAVVEYGDTLSEREQKGKQKKTQRKSERNKISLIDRLTLHAHDAAVFGSVTLTLGLVMGAAWGKFAWGDYWSWDPKENWALITWLAYMVYLHLRLVSGWQGRRSLWLLVAAFGAVMFTYLGMNLLPTAGDSLHVYQ